MRQTRPSTAAFTLVELLIVVTVLTALAGISYPMLSAVLEDGRAGKAQASVDAVSAAIAAHGQGRVIDVHPTRTVILDGVTQPERRVFRRWDLDGGGWLDGDPDRDLDFAGGPGGYGSSYREIAARAGYRGSVELAITTAGAGRDAASGRLIDPWGGDLRIGFGPGYGPAGVGVWSLGPNQTDEGGAGDDITSW